jgi:hypothetical protein
VESEAPVERRTSGAAIASLVLGIVGVTVFPLVPSILAVVFGSRARDEVRADAAVSGDGLATAGIILGWIGVAISLLGFLFFVVGVALFFGV